MQLGLPEMERRAAKKLLRTVMWDIVNSITVNPG